jgi:hypothetical protein
MVMQLHCITIPKSLFFLFVGRNHGHPHIISLNYDVFPVVNLPCLWYIQQRRTYERANTDYRRR